MSASAIRGMTWSIISMTTTSLPMLTSERAASSPMTPAPAMATFLASLRAASIAFPSLMVLIPKTPFRSLPSTGGMKTELPVAMTRESYWNSLPSSVTTFLSASETDVTFVFVNTSMSLSFL